MLIDSDDLAIIEGVITLSGAFRREIIAEGVESVAHGEMLLQLGCNLAQGYSIAKPMPAEMIDPWLKEYTPEILWQKTQQLRRDKITYLHAIVEHTAWAQKLLLHLEDPKNPAPQLNPFRCNFALWLDGHPDKERPEFKQVTKMHFELHHLSSKVLHSQGEARAKEIEIFKERSTLFLEELRRLSQL